MPYTSPATVVTGTTITSAWGNSVKAGEDFLANPPACRVYHNAAQSVGDNSIIQVAFNSERYDTDTMHDNVTNNSRITFKTAGIYVVTFSGDFVASNDYQLVRGFLRLNGTTLIAISSYRAANLAGYTENPSINLTTVYKFAVNDYVEIQVSQDNAANVARNLQATGNYTPEFAATWIGLG